ncbi:glycine cleavage system aminomethyltransferase GcvT [Actinomycetospora soli]|uniref:glycine cleavage system aminomethyltransferase GcvT n=1 Tax=Actinomycetospora soli TaxID=2893887 RepID=UPI001E2939CB|nr:glycine cleavage system aminomethyltransferase GcvT [Actinomycetospora soli]MCD2190676.1 glycine cleavage system aminomethyltransferase GcvT [Actinomycetospora soli]
MTEQRQDLRRSPLHARHEALGATFAPFGGWEMPVQYSGTVAEHTATREAVGLFDVSHLGKVRISGPGAAAFVDRCLTNDLGRIVPGKAQYTLCCAADGGVVDDLILYLVGDDEVFAVPNAANSAGVGRQLADAAPDGITVTDEHDAHVVLAVQGPRSRAVLAETGVLPETGDVDLDYMAFVDSTWEDREVRVCRTGYTGEHGYELIAPAEVAETLWDALAAVVAEQGGLPAGLGARDTLRTEAGLPLHGQDLGPEITPVQARVGFAVGWKKAEFWGREALLAERERGPRRRAWGLKASGRGVPRAHMTVTVGGSPVGETTSGTFSPTLRTGIALALLDTAAGLSEGDVVSIDVRGRALECEVVAPPFVASHVR